MQENVDDDFVDEIDGRLDDLFAEDETAQKDEGKGNEIKEYPLKGLKAIILSIDWEITDDVMKRLADQVIGLKKRYKDDKIVFILLQLLGSIGDYIRTSRGKSHPDSFKFLNSLFKKLDKVVRTKGLSESEKKKILSVEVNKYKVLKDKLSSQKIIAQKEKDVKPAVKAKTEKKDMLPIELFADAMDQIRQLIQSEFKTLREELRLGREKK
jgi:hypothetical protein